MTVALMLVWEDDGRQARGLGELRGMLAGLAGLERALIHRPQQGSGHGDAAPPALAVQIEFDDIKALESAAAATGVLQALPDFLPTGLGAGSQQAFLSRRYPVAAPAVAACSYLVHYPGPAQNIGDWLQHYADHHIPLMCRLPQIREVEMLTCIDHLSSLPMPRARHMQRNRVAFDSPADLAAALNSPIRTQMRADVGAYPPFEGGIYHFTMRTETIGPCKKDPDHVV